MGFKQRTGGGSSALDKVRSGFAQDPKEFAHGKELGDDCGVVLRFLSLHEEDVYLQAGRRAKVANAKHKDKEPLNLVIPDPGPDFNEDIYDDEGDALAALPEADTLFVPVWVLYTVDKNGYVDEEIEEMRYLRMGVGLQRSLKSLKDNVKDGYEFEDIPPYDVRLETFNETGIKNYRFVPVTRIITAPEKRGGKATVEDCPRNGVDDLAEALGADTMKVLDEEFDDLIAHFTKIAKDEQKPENVKKRFLHYRSSGGGGSKEESEPTEKRNNGMRRSLKKAEPDPEGEEEETQEPEWDEKTSGAKTSRFNGLKKRG